MITLLWVTSSSLTFAQERGRAAAGDTPKPQRFPHRIWAACDFEAQTPDYAWFGKRETEDIPAYPGNATALRIAAGSNHVGMNPVPGPCMGKANYMYCRYRLKGATEATFQHFSLSINDNNHIRVSGLTEGAWSELTLNFSKQGRRNDGTPGIPFKEGERMDDLKIFVGRGVEMTIDDVIFFSEDPDLPPETEPFPNRVIFLAAFDTGTSPKDRPKYYPGEMEIVSSKSGAPAGSYWGVAKAVPQKKGKWIRLKIDPPKPVGARTKLRFRYHLTGVTSLTTQIFDLTDGDNRHVRLQNLAQGEWKFAIVDFTRDAQRNDGRDTPFAAGHKVDDIFFFVEGDSVELFVDEVTLFDSAER